MAKRRGFTLLELLIVAVIIATVTALLLPAIQRTRESARSSLCRDNLKQIGHAILQYDSAHKNFPMGAEGKFDPKLWPSRTYGMSWWPTLLPFLEQQAVADRLDYRGISTGWVQLNSQNGTVADGFAPAFWFCPTSEIEQLVTIGSFRLAAPSYTGISGASSHEGFPETRVSACCRSDGEISAGGILIPNSFVRTAQIADGLSKTLLVGEQSDFAFNKHSARNRIDPGYPNGWICGTMELGTPPVWSTQFAGVYNLATIRYALNVNDYDLPGVYRDRGANNPLVSSHDGVVNLLFSDGSVHAVRDDLDIFVLKQVATRDDGMSIAD